MDVTFGSIWPNYHPPLVMGLITVQCIGKHVAITPRHSLAWIIPAVQSPEVYMKSMYVMYFLVLE